MADENGNNPGFIEPVTIYQLRLGEGSIVEAAYSSNIHQEGAIECDANTFEEALLNLGKRRLIDGVLVIYDPPPLPEPVPQSISDRQFFQQLAIEGIISEDEALATSDGTLPSLLNTIIDQIPAADRFAARMKAKNATVYERQDPLTMTVAYALNQMGTHGTWDPARLDQFWTDAAKL